MPEKQPKPQSTFQKGICLEDITIGGHTHFVKNQTVYFKRKITKKRNKKMPETYLKQIKKQIGKDQDGCTIYETVEVEAINQDETQTLIFFGYGKTVNEYKKVEKFNKWYSLSSNQEKSFQILQLF